MSITRPMIHVWTEAAKPFRREKAVLSAVAEISVADALQVCSALTKLGAPRDVPCAVLAACTSTSVRSKKDSRWSGSLAAVKLCCWVRFLCFLNYLYVSGVIGEYLTYACLHYRC